MWLLLLKIALLVAVVEGSIRLLSRWKAGDGSERANHLRGSFLVAVLTITVVGLAVFL